jgi:Heavy metal associated domain 2
MMPVIDYVHAIEGRLRVKVVEVKGSPEHARRVEALFAGVAGVREVRANPITGNVLFLHDADAVAAREILGALIAAGYMGMGADAGRGRPRDVAEVAATVAELVAWAVLHAWKGFAFNPGQDLVERLVESAVRFLVRLLAGRLRAAATMTATATAAAA